MAQTIFQLKSFLTYWLDSVSEHSLHSPFFYDFYSKVVKAKPTSIASIEVLRKKLIADNRYIHVNDLGSQSHRNKKRRIADIANASLTPAKFSSLYYRIISYYNHKHIIELGTSLGTNALYLALREGSQVTTFEGADEIAELASITFDFAGSKNVRLITGNIDTTLPSHLQSVRKVDFAFLDANHRYQPTIKYFDLLLARLHMQSVVVIDDIHYSAEMEKAWNEIRRHKLVYGSADLYRCGILFFDPSLNKQHVILQF